jgi:hypothetical protein
MYTWERNAPATDRREPEATPCYFSDAELNLMLKTSVW